jgi:tight adherence protein B
VARAIADALTGGHSVRGALAEAAHAGGVPGAAGAELARCAGQLALGERTEDVLTALARRTRLPAYDTLVAAILLQRDAGGDLAGLLRGVARSLEESARAAAEARSATAQARFTAGMVSALPAGAAALAELAQPGYLLSLAAEPIPAFLAGTAAVLQVAALLVVRRLGRVRA